MRSRSTPRAGFTFLELLLVLVILGSVAALLGANLGAGLTADHHRVAARDLAATLRLARDRAALTGRPQRVVLTWSPPSLRVEEQTDPLDDPQTWTVPGPQWTQERALKRNVRWKTAVVSPDEDDRTAYGDDEQSADAVAIEYAPDGQHRLVLPDEDAGLPPAQARPLELTIAGPEGDELLVVRIEIAGRIRVLTQSQLEADKEDQGLTGSGSRQTSSGSGAGR